MQAYGNMKFIKLIYFSGIIILALACSEKEPVIPDDNSQPAGYEYTVPPQADDGWQIIHLDSVGINTATIENMVDNISPNSMPDLHSILIVRDGKLCFERYFNGWNGDDLHMLMSCTKSVTSALTGLAIYSGYINGVEEKIFDLFPEYDTLRTSRKDSVKIKHVLSMSSGLSWDQTSYGYDSPHNSLYQMLIYPGSWIYFVLSRNDMYSPGEYFAYSDGMAMLAGEIIRRAVGQSIKTFADSLLFQPLGIDSVKWGNEIDGSTNSGYGLYLRSRDMAKFGQLYLSGGIWDGTQIIPQAWILESTSEKINMSSNLGYGYFWWLTNYYLPDALKIKAIVASGNYGQYIFIFPELNEVVVFTMGRPDGDGYDQARWALLNFILPASI